MNTSNRKVSAVAGLLALGLFGTLSVNAAEGPTDTSKTTSPSCHQETRRVAVWPHGPGKGLQMPRYETRTLVVCDHERKMSKPERTASQPTFGPRYR
jgi:hypothetical protein